MTEQEEGDHRERVFKARSGPDETLSYKNNPDIVKNHHKNNEKRTRYSLPSPSSRSRQMGDIKGEGSNFMY